MIQLTSSAPGSSLSSHRAHHEQQLFLCLLAPAGQPPSTVRSSYDLLHAPASVVSTLSLLCLPLLDSSSAFSCRSLSASSLAWQPNTSCVSSTHCPQHSWQQFLEIQMSLLHRKGQGFLEVVEAVCGAGKTQCPVIISPCVCHPHSLPLCRIQAHGSHG